MGALTHGAKSSHLTDHALQRSMHGLSGYMARSKSGNPCLGKFSFGQMNLESLDNQMGVSTHGAKSSRWISHAPQRSMHGLSGYMARSKNGNPCLGKFSFEQMNLE